MFSSTFGEVGVGCGLLSPPCSSPLSAGFVGLVGVTFLKICVTTSSLVSVLTNSYPSISPASNASLASPKTAGAFASAALSSLPSSSVHLVMIN